MQFDPELVEEGRSIREKLWRVARYAEDAADAWEARIEDRSLNSMAEAEELREALEGLQTLSLEVNEELDAYPRSLLPSA